MPHRHKDSRLKWTTTDAEPEVTHPADVLTAAEVSMLKVLVAGGRGGTVPVPNPPQVPPPDITAPVISGIAQVVTTTTATITWTTNEATTGVVEYGSTTGYGTTTAATSSGTSHSRTLTGLTPGQTYQYQVRATDTASNVGLSGNRTLITTASPTLPGAPTGLTATGASTAVTLNWVAPTSNGGSAITGYRVYRNGASLIVLGVVTTYNNTGLTNGLTYTYTVAAITAVGEGPQSNTASATPSAGGDINPPVPINIVATVTGQTTATIAWSQLEAGTGQVRYGTTIAYGQTTTLEAGYLTAHSQNITGLTAGATYHFQVVTVDIAGNTGLSSDRWFTTTSVPVPPPVPPASTTAYGSGISCDSRNNKPIGGVGLAKLTYRFRASTTSTLTGFRVSERGGAQYYAGGNGGTIRASIKADSGGEPTGAALATVSWSPGNPTGWWEVHTLHTFSSPPSLTSGTLYHIVFDNIHADPVTNFISLNMVFTYNGMWPSPRFPAFSNDFAGLYAEPTTWDLLDQDLPVVDLIYADSTHDGQGYIGMLWQNLGNISGTNEMVRERFTVTGGTRNVLSAHTKVKRITGSSALIVTLETGAGSLIEAVSIPSSQIPVGQMPFGGGSADLGGNTWANATFLSTRTLTNGSTYNLRLSTAVGTQYIAVPVQEGTAQGFLSKRFTDGDGQRTTNAGSSWGNLYQWEPVDLQFFFEVA